MKPGDHFTIVTDTPDHVHSDEAPFEVVFHDQGVSVHVNIGYVATVHDRSADKVDCGHQRPLEVLRAWTESAEAAARRTAESPTLRDVTRRHAEHMRWALTRAEAADQQAQEIPPAA